MIRCENGVVILDGPSGPLYPTADQLFAAIFENAESICGQAISAADFIGTGLSFSAYAAEAVMTLIPTDDPAHPEIAVKLDARDGDKLIPVARTATGFADYGCDGSMWIPLAPGSIEAFEAVVGKLSERGTITLKQYLACTARRSRDLTINDRVPEQLAVSGQYPAPEIPLPDEFSGTLYPYQATGFRWLAYMTGQGVPGCLLADEMGLGKTVQIICAFLAVTKTGITQPALIVAPATLLENWRREFKKFAPSVTPLVHRGAQRFGIVAPLSAEDVVITSYETLLSDVSLLAGVEWGLLVLDEAQAIKNPAARRTAAVKSLSRRAAIAVTGTPVENRLTDLWSIADFLLPNRLGTLTEFERDFPETRDGAAALEPRISPFILRRRVSDVARDLPARIDIPQVIELDSKSAEVYERIRQGADPNMKGSALATLGKLRTFCAHPWLVDELRAESDPTNCSNKLLRVREILEELFSCGEKALIFTSYHEMSDMLARHVARWFNVAVWQIDGRTNVPERQPLVDKFSGVSEAAVLVLNPRAAGTGLNIVAANHVVHYNLEWNPAVEDQASARAFRRGQTRPVTIHRLFYSSTVEEYIDARAASKRELASSSIVGSDGSEVDAGELVRALSMTPGGKS